MEKGENMIADLRLHCFLATGWFIKPNGNVSTAVKHAIKENIEKEFGRYGNKFGDIDVTVHDISSTHFSFANQNLLGPLRWLKQSSVLCDTDTIDLLTFDNTAPQDCSFSDILVLKGLIRDLDYLSRNGDSIKTIIFFDRFFSNIPFFQKEYKIFEALGYHVYIYSLESGALTTLDNQNGGTANAQNKTTNVSDSDHNDSITDFITKRFGRKESGGFGGNVVRSIFDGPY